MTVTLLARLAKSRLRVLCGRIECGTTIADVREQLEGRVVIFPSGWTKDPTGIYRLTRRARQRRARGQSLGYRRPPAPTHYFRPDDTPARTYYSVTPREYPALAQCPECGFIQTLDSAQLDVIIEPRFLYPNHTRAGRDGWHASRYKEWAFERGSLSANVDPLLNREILVQGEHEADAWAELYSDSLREGAHPEDWP